MLDDDHVGDLSDNLQGMLDLGCGALITALSNGISDGHHLNNKLLTLNPMMTSPQWDIPQNCQRDGAEAGVVADPEILTPPDDKNLPEVLHNPFYAPSPLGLTRSQRAAAAAALLVKAAEYVRLDQAMRAARTPSESMRDAFATSIKERRGPPGVSRLYFSS